MLEQKLLLITGGTYIFLFVSVEVNVRLQEQLVFLTAVTTEL